MPKTKPTFEDGILLAHSRILGEIDNRIRIARMGGSDLADSFIDLKRHLPTPEQIVAESEQPK